MATTDFPNETRSLHRQSVLWATGTGLFAAFALFLQGVLHHDFWVYYEGRRALIALEMYQRGSFLVPHLLGTPIVTKPPLYYWFAALCYALCGGGSDWAARLPSVIAGAAGAGALTFLLQPLIGVESAILSGLILAVTPIYFWMAQIAEPEMLSVGLGVVAMCWVARMLFNGKGGWRRRFTLYLIAGLAFLAKGPLVPAPLLLVILVVPPILRKRGHAPPKFCPVVGSLLILAPMAIWVFLLSFRGFTPWRFVQNSLTHVGLSEDKTPYAKSPNYYLDHLGVFAFPWWYLVEAALVAGVFLSWRNRGGRGWRGALAAAREYLLAGRGERLFLLTWFLSTLAVLSAIPSKRFYYSLGLAPPLAALCGMIYRDCLLLSSRAAPPEREPRRPGRRRAWICAAGLVGALSLLVVGFLLRLPDPPHAYSGEHRLDPKALCLWPGLWLVGLALLGFRRWKWPFARLCALWTVLTVTGLAMVYTFVVHPRINERLSLKKAARQVVQRLPPGAPVFSVGGNHTIWFYLGRTQVQVVRPEEVAGYAAAHPAAIGLVYGKDLADVPHPQDYEILYRSAYIRAERNQVFLIRRRQ